MDPVELDALFDIDDAQFRQHFRHTPLWRAHRRGLLRNAAIILGNQRQPSALIPLEKGLSDIEPMVRGASAWAIGQINSPPARKILLVRHLVENDEDVLSEITNALNQA